MRWRTWSLCERNRIGPPRPAPAAGVANLGRGFRAGKVDWADRLAYRRADTAERARGKNSDRSAARPTPRRHAGTGISLASRLAERGLRPRGGARTDWMADHVPFVVVPVELFVMHVLVHLRPKVPRELSEDGCFPAVFWGSLALRWQNKPRQCIDAGRENWTASVSAPALRSSCERAPQMRAGSPLMKVTSAGCSWPGLSWIGRVSS